MQAELPFAVHRTEVGKQLPVYTDFKNGRSRVVTLIRKYDGDEAALADEAQRVCGEVSVFPRADRAGGPFARGWRSIC